MKKCATQMANRLTNAVLHSGFDIIFWSTCSNFLDFQTILSQTQNNAIKPKRITDLKCKMHYLQTLYSLICAVIT